METDPPIARRRKGLLGWLKAHPWTTGMLGMLILLVGGVFMLDCVAESRLEDRLEAIRAAGEPMTVDDLIDAYPDIPDEENMALILLEHAGKISEFALDEKQQALVPLMGSDSQRTPSGQRLPAAELEAARAYLEGVAEDLAGVHRALRFERGCLPTPWTTPALATNIPTLSDFRQAVRVLALDALVAAQQGDAQRGIEVVKEMLHLDRALQCNTTLIAFLVRIACQATAQDFVELTFNLSEMDDRTLLSLQAAFAAKEGAFAIKDAMMTERIIFLDTMTWMRSGSRTAAILGPGAAPVTGGWYRFIPAIPDLDMSAGLDVYAGMIEAATRPDGKAVTLARETEARSGNMPKYCLFSRMLVPALARTVELWVRVIGSNRALVAGLACERFRLATGHWPDDLEVLVPDYMPEIPLDPFDDKPIRFLRTDQGIKVYCIGEDLTDDGGDIRRYDLPPDTTVRATDWGWIFLNPDLRGRPAPVRED